LILDKEVYSIMVTQTRSESVAQSRTDAIPSFLHVRDNIMLKDSNSDLAKALLIEGVEDIRDLLVLNKEVVMRLHCLQEVSPATDTDDQVMRDLPLRAAQTGVLLCFLAYCDWRSNPENQLGPIDDDWTSITLRSFDDFRVGPYLRNNMELEYKVVASNVIKAQLDIGNDNGFNEGRLESKAPLITQPPIESEKQSNIASPLIDCQGTPATNTTNGADVVVAKVPQANGSKTHGSLDGVLVGINAYKCRTPTASVESPLASRTPTVNVESPYATKDYGDKTVGSFDGVLVGTFAYDRSTPTASVESPYSCGTNAVESDAAWKDQDQFTLLHPLFGNCPVDNKTLLEPQTIGLFGFANTARPPGMFGFTTNARPPGLTLELSRCLSSFGYHKNRARVLPNPKPCFMMGSENEATANTNSFYRVSQRCATDLLPANPGMNHMPSYGTAVRLIGTNDCSFYCELFLLVSPVHDQQFHYCIFMALIWGAIMRSINGEHEHLGSASSQ
jgi:hypothetical protein